MILDHDEPGDRDGEKKPPDTEERPEVNLHFCHISRKESMQLIML